MKVARHSSVATLLADALDAQAQLLTETASALRLAQAETAESKYIDQTTSPLSKRVFLAHARRGSFPTKRVGKRVLVERDVFTRWLNAQEKRPCPTPPASGPRSLDEAVLAELGARSAGAHR